MEVLLEEEEQVAVEDGKEILMEKDPLEVAPNLTAQESSIRSKFHFLLMLL